MKSTKELFDERLHRIKATVALQKTDRVPIVPLGDAFCAKVAGVKLSEFCTIPELSNETMVKVLTNIGEIDGVQHVNFNAHNLSLIWLSKLKIPGRDIGEDQLWQVQEVELMTVDDYDAIINDGYEKFLDDYYMNRLDNLNAKLQPVRESFPAAIQSFVEKGIVPLSPVIVTIPFEIFCGGRSLVTFLKDLYRRPDQVQAAMDAAMPFILEQARQLCRLGLIGAWVGGWRSASEFMSPKLWQRFVLPYYKQLIQVVVDEGVIPILHFDSNWTRDLEVLKELPKAKCVLSLDGATDIFKAKEILGDHMCIMGDVPPAMLTLGTPDEVHEYCTRLIREIGPTGFILAQGCDIPPNAKLENVKAMVASVHG